MPTMTTVTQAGCRISVCVLIAVAALVGRVEAASKPIIKLQVEHLLRPNSIQLAVLQAVQSNIEKGGGIKLQIKGVAPSLNAGRAVIGKIQ